MTGTVRVPSMSKHTPRMSLLPLGALGATAPLPGAAAALLPFEAMLRCCTDLLSPPLLLLVKRMPLSRLQDRSRLLIHDDWRAKHGARKAAAAAAQRVVECVFSGSLAACCAVSDGGGCQIMLLANRLQ